MFAYKPIGYVNHNRQSVFEINLSCSNNNNNNVSGEIYSDIVSIRHNMYLSLCMCVRALTKRQNIT